MVFGSANELKIEFVRSANPNFFSLNYLDSPEHKYALPEP